MATTHYSELKILRWIRRAQNACCEFDVETLRPTYRLSVGVPGKSNAFLISQKLGLAPEIIENARAHLSNEDQQFDNILNQLEDMKVELKAQQDEVERLEAHGLSCTGAGRGKTCCAYPAGRGKNWPLRGRRPTVWCRTCRTQPTA